MLDEAFEEYKYRYSTGLGVTLYVALDYSTSADTSARRLLA